MNWWRKFWTEKRRVNGVLYYLYERGTDSGTVTTYTTWMRQGQETDECRLYRWHSGSGQMIQVGQTIGFCKAVKSTGEIR